MRFTIFAILVLLVLISNTQAYSQLVNETQLINQSNSVEINENTTTIQPSLLEPDDKTELNEIKELLKNLELKIAKHDTNSHFEGILSYAIGGTIALFGIFLTVKQMNIDKQRQVTEKEKIRKLEEKTKWILGDILERIDTFEGKSLSNEQIKSSASWKHTQVLVDKLRFMVIPVSKDLKNDLGEELLGYVVYMGKEFENMANNEKTNVDSIKNNTLKILNKYFPEFENERKEAFQTQIAYLEEEFEKEREKELAAYMKYYQEEIEMEHKLDEYLENKSRIDLEDSEKQDQETAKDMEEYSMDIEDDEENDYRGK